MSNKYDGYRAISSVYDRINSHIDYAAWADFFEKCFDKHLCARPELMLDLACGTGSMTLELAKRGYDMIGVDGSAEMLNIALDRKYDLELENDVLFLLQDMREFELYGTVGAISCCLDSINYLTDDGDLEKVFALAHNYLDPDGLFLFDVNTPYKFENIYGNNTYIYEDEDCGEGNFCAWQNFYDKKTQLCDFSLTVFERNEDKKTYSRRDELQTERCYSRASLEASLKAQGFELIGFYSDFDFTPATDTDERWYVVARAKKENYEKN